MSNRRKFLKNSALSSAALLSSSITFLSSCSNDTPKKLIKMKDLNISLAQWSLNEAFFAGDLDPNNFAAIAKKDYGINAIEYVNQFYKEKGNDEKFWNGLRAKADQVGVQSLLIMVDDEGDLGDASEEKIQQSVENHYKWVNAAKILGCHSIRVNAFGEGSKEEVGKALVQGLGKLAEYGAKEKINILIENHGLYSSDANFIVDIIKQVDNPYLGTLPDFGNWCLNAKWGSISDNKCTESFDIYSGVSNFLPYAKGVSAKAYQFDERGNETSIDYIKMLAIVKANGFDGFVGIEYEGKDMTPPEGIKATKTLLEKSWKLLHE